MANPTYLSRYTIYYAEMYTDSFPRWAGWYISQKEYIDLVKDTATELNHISLRVVIYIKVFPLTMSRPVTNNSSFIVNELCDRAAAVFCLWLTKIGYVTVVDGS